MRNRYEGECYRCGKIVAPGAGHFEKSGKRWKVQHAECAVAYRGTGGRFRDGTAMRPESMEQARAWERSRRR